MSSSLGAAWSDEEEIEQLAVAIQLSLSLEEPENEFELVEAAPEVRPALSGAERRAAAAGYGGSSSSSTSPPAAAPAAAAKAAAKALPAAPPRLLPRRIYVVWRVAVGSEASLGIHFGRWPQVGVPNNNLAGSGWALKAASSATETQQIWAAKRPGVQAPIHHHA